MVFDVIKASDYPTFPKTQVSINSIEELKLFMEFNNNDVIVYRPDDYRYKNYTLVIYDDYWE